MNFSLVAALGPGRMGTLGGIYARVYDRLGGQAAIAGCGLLPVFLSFSRVPAARDSCEGIGSDLICRVWQADGLVGHGKERGTGIEDDTDII